MKKISMLLLCMLLVTLCACGKYEFYNPDIVKQDPVLSYLVKKDISG